MYENENRFENSLAKAWACKIDLLGADVSDVAIDNNNSNDDDDEEDNNADGDSNNNMTRAVTSIEANAIYYLQGDILKSLKSE